MGEQEREFACDAQSSIPKGPAARAARANWQERVARESAANGGRRWCNLSSSVRAPAKGGGAPRHCPAPTKAARLGDSAQSRRSWRTGVG